MLKLPMFRPLARYAEFNGRSNRAEFWWFLLFMYGVAGLFYGAMYLASLKDGRPDLDTFLPRYMQFSPLLSLFSFGLLVPYLAVAVRRLHDTNRTGWWLMVPVATSLVGYILFFVIEGQHILEIMADIMVGMQSEAMDSPGATMNPVAILKLEWPLFALMLPWSIIPNLVGTALILILCALPGNPGNNRFGPPPAKD